MVNDVQVNMLANHGVYTRPPTATDLQKSLDILRQISVLGVVDRFDESLIAAEYFLRPTFPTLQFHYVKQNVSPTDGDTSMRPDAQLRRELGGAVYDHLQKLNQLDYELLEYAKEEVARRLALVPEREQREIDFRRRCEFLQTVHEAAGAAGRENTLQTIDTTS
jgi:hypothetical protein